jgi:hypothetical protein
MPIIDPTPPEWEPEPDGPCGLWPIDMECCPEWPAEVCDWTPRHLLSVEIATDMLWRLTAGRYGLCVEVIRPCRESCVDGDPGLLSSAYGSGLLRPYVNGGRWFNIGCGCPKESCACGPLESISLAGPVNEIIEVRIDGEPLTVGAWRLRRFGARSRLVRTDGHHWPKCQDMTKSDDEPGTFSISYLRGRKVPAAGVRAVSNLAGEIFKQCANQKCRLPDRTKTVSREGVTYEMYDPGAEMEKGLTGLREVDMWLRSVNPAALRQPSAVFSLDLPPAPEHERGRWEQQ